MTYLILSLLHSAQLIGGSTVRTDTKRATFAHVPNLSSVPFALDFSRVATVEFEFFHFTPV